MKIFSILSSARTFASVILAGKLDSCHCSTMSFREDVVVLETIYQMGEVLSLFSGERAQPPPIKVTVLAFQEKKKSAVK